MNESIQCQTGGTKKNPHHISLKFKNKKCKEKILTANKTKKHIISKEQNQIVQSQQWMQNYGSRISKILKKKILIKNFLSVKSKDLVNIFPGV